jgi:serine/threonine protein kinase
MFRARFSQGVDAARRVKGKLTVPVIDARVDDVPPWMATAYVPGPTLRQLTDRQGVLSGRLLLALAAGLAEGLREIHAAGVVHRDLKPSNVVLGGNGPRIVDFSFAMRAGAGGGGWIVGTHGFMSPEQERGGPVGPASDVFSLGAALSFAATGQGPFRTGASATDWASWRSPDDEPDLVAVPGLIQPVVARCLAWDPADRPTAAELTAAVYDLAARQFGLDAHALRGVMGAISAWSGPHAAPGDALMPPKNRADYLEYGDALEYETESERIKAPGTAVPLPPAQRHEREYRPPPRRRSGRGKLGLTAGESPETDEPETALPPHDDDPYGEYSSPDRGSPAPAPPPPNPASPPSAAIPAPPPAPPAGKTPAPAPPATEPAPGPVPTPPAPLWPPTPPPLPPQQPPAQGYAPAPRPPTPAPAPELEADIRFLTGVLPDRAPTGTRLSLLVLIGLRRGAAPSAALKSFGVPPSGTTVTISVSAPGLQPMGDLEQDLFVPFAADSEPIRFGFVTGPEGLRTVVVRAFSGGTFLGELTLELSVEPGAVLEEARPRTAELSGLAAEPGEVTLQVSRTDEGRYSFQLIGEAWNRVEITRRLAGDPAQVVGALAEELRAMSANESRFASPALVRNRIKNLGAQLWADVVPEAIRRQFWEQGDRIKLFTIASDMDTVPWELLYPVDGHNDNGFLVEQFPVVRRVYGQGRTRVLRLDGGAAYIVPPGSPANAMAEVNGIRGIFPGNVRNRGVHETLAGFTELLDAVPSVLHFACHNAFTEKGGSVITLDGGPLRPSDLAFAVAQKGLAAISPLVFLNACRTAGDIAGLMQLVGWARQFMGAGAGAFIGSLWAVRSSSAKTFAEAFYRAMISDGMTLGAASLRARQEISGDPGDPTWLAYTVYGNPSAAVGQ